MQVEAYIERWTQGQGGAERANYQMFLSELCDVIGVARPQPAGPERQLNDYVFERAVRRRPSDEISSSRRIDLYKRGCFILEAKQSRLPGAKNALPAHLALPVIEPQRLGRRGAGRNWDAMMSSAKKQAEDYVFLLDGHHPAPPFLITCDVGHALEIFADFTGNGRSYEQFGGRKGFRVYLEDLRREDVRDMLARIWTDPTSLDPARQSTRVTRQIAERLATVCRSLERHYPAEEVALFVMRCIFCMFAEDVDLLPKGEFTRLLEDSAQAPRSLVPLLEELWSKMDEPREDKRFFSFFRAHLRHFNGNLYRNARAFPLESAEIGELVAAAKHEWAKVDPAIFGTLLEQALDTTQRRKLGAHYTPRAYVQRLVEVTVMEPLRGDWRRALTMAEAAKDEGDDKRAIAIVRGFQHTLCTTRVLDPACGTGNFLYVSLEMMKKLEGEILETLVNLGDNETFELDQETVSPHQFLGLELNPRAAAIAELVIWIGYLQQHYKTHTGHPGEPILKAFSNINFGRKDGYDAVLAAEDDAPANPIRPYWPDAEFIVGNPPFIGGKDLRARLGSDYAEALWKAHDHINESADFVMYWWDRAAGLLTRKASVLRRFGLVTTNSISQMFQRRVIERHLNAENPISLIFAIPDHPWTKATKDSAAVRIAMTVGEAGKREGVLLQSMREADLRTDEPQIDYASQSGAIHSDLSCGLNLTAPKPLTASKGLSSRGVQLMGSGFMVSRSEAQHLGLDRRPDLDRHIRDYRNGRDLTARSRDCQVIDLLGLSADDVRRTFPEVYQHLTERVRYDLDHTGQPRTDKDGRKLGREWNNRASYKDNWWVFGEPRKELRPALEGLSRYIATVETTKHRVFQFLDASILPDNMVVVIASDAACALAILSSSIHRIWAANLGGTLEDRPRYTKAQCFDPFPFPAPSDALRHKLRDTGEELDALRKAVLADHTDLTLTGLYNVLEKLKAGTDLSPRDEDVKHRGLVMILQELHATIDRLTAQAYGWPVDLTDAQILERLVALNAERAREEAAGHVRWLRPDYQIARFARDAKAKTGELDLAENVVAIDAGKPVFPKDRYEQPLAVEALLASSITALDAATISRAFKGGGKKIEARVGQVLVTLARYGRVSALHNGTFAARRAA